ncbi:hypothetical protein AOL_s00173g246 [Orbilia oligospora ATCC 24927]|uniref:Uncharacterized protein n=1 Tax=Arthrobotrys oligospora (strain ATCC 24927 / CBS 115.81 / DSM 1491) TaxID=756982 RepID=G1XP78_ARTOA|nr:hypothetical protein AOL_s00173g246 [Orbilia oligospora ATCC 24927]EGX45145.1 hypothetical protein AOL_s00173g246 [Orbilia oligospora ATCC 24927]
MVAHQRMVQRISSCHRHCKGSIKNLRLNQRPHSGALTLARRNLKPLPKSRENGLKEKLLVVAPGVISAEKSRPTLKYRFTINQQLGVGYGHTTLYKA